MRIDRIIRKQGVAADRLAITIEFFRHDFPYIHEDMDKEQAKKIFDAERKSRDEEWKKLLARIEKIWGQL